jgi:hypothetical protein
VVDRDIKNAIAKLLKISVRQIDVLVLKQKFFAILVATVAHLALTNSNVVIIV